MDNLICEKCGRTAADDLDWNFHEAMGECLPLAPLSFVPRNPLAFDSKGMTDEEYYDELFRRQAYSETRHDARGRSGGQEKKN